VAAGTSTGPYEPLAPGRSTLDKDFARRYLDLLTGRSATVAPSDIDRVLRERPSSGPVDELVEPDYADISERYFVEADLDAIE